MKREADSDVLAAAGSPANREMVRLMEAEIERLQAELAAVRAGTHPQRRTLIVDRVQRLDERQDALARLQTLIAEAQEQAHKPEQQPE